mgnify:CR=1 FL=1
MKGKPKTLWLCRDQDSAGESAYGLYSQKPVFNSVSRLWNDEGGKMGPPIFEGMTGLSLVPGEGPIPVRLTTFRHKGSKS